MLLLGPTVSVEYQCDCCAARSSSISSEDGMLSLGPAVSVNVEREVCELPVERTAETGLEVDQSDSQRPSWSVTVFLSPHPAMASSSKARQDTYELPVCQQEIALNDTTSIVQHDNTDCKQFEGEVEQGLSVPRIEVNSDDVCDESVENLTGVNGAVILYSDPVQTGPSPSEIQSADAPRRPACAAARPSRFTDDQFETQFRPGSKNKVRQMHFNPGKGEPSAVNNVYQPPKIREQECQDLGKGEQRRDNSPQTGQTRSPLTWQTKCSSSSQRCRTNVCKDRYVRGKYPSSSRHAGPRLG